MYVSISDLECQLVAFICSIVSTWARRTQGLIFYAIGWPGGGPPHASRHCCGQLSKIPRPCSIGRELAPYSTRTPVVLRPRVGSPLHLPQLLLTWSAFS